MNKMWCDTVTKIPLENGGFDEDKCRWQVMNLKSMTVKNIPDIEAYVCPKCGNARYLPGSSISKFLDGINKI